MGSAASAILSHLFLAYLVCVLPWLGRLRYCWLKQRIEAGDQQARLRFYQLVLAAQLGMALVVLAIWRLGAFAPAAFGFVAPAHSTEMTIAAAAFLISLVVSSLMLRHKGDRQLGRLLKMAGPLLPVSTAERRLFATVAIGAGIAEELAFRGFLLFYFATFLPGLGTLVAVLASSAAFGLGHLYQGVRGVALTAALGLFMAALYVLSGSLLVPMVVHAALDLRLLVIVTPERLRRLTESTEPRP
ncbi:MAG TPA: type II CAAX endopeptidase family protein [Bryobacteraceae bacterium]|nr:type II CAAX endopeptidase family protein [Bryobacteraceae bacterium]